MKNLLSLARTSMLALPLAAFGQGSLKIGTINMDRAFKEYTKTKEAEKKINDAKDAAKKEFDDRTDAYKKALEEVNNLNKQLESQALSADKKTQLAKDRDDKINNIKNMEREINEFRQTRENQLREQALRMRERCCHSPEQARPRQHPQHGDACNVAGRNDRDESEPAGSRQSPGGCFCHPEKTVGLLCRANARLRQPACVLLFRCRVFPRFLWRDRRGARHS